MPTTEISTKSYRHWNLAGKSWDGVVFFGVDFCYSNLSDAKFSNCKFTNALFCNADLSEADFTNCEFVEVDFESANMHDIHLRDCKFTNAYLHLTNMRQAAMQNVTLDTCVMSYGNLTYSSIIGLRLVTTTINGVSLSHATIRDLVLVDAGLADVGFEDASLFNVTIDGQSKLGSVSFARASLHNIAVQPSASIRGLNMEGVRRRNCSPLLFERQKKCPVCGQKRSSGEFHGKVAVCDSCKQIGNYSDQNDRRVGRPSVLPTFSFEFELEVTDHEDDNHLRSWNSEDDEDEDDYHGSEDSDGSRDYPLAYTPQETDILLLHGFLKTSDGTVDEEWKSPIYMDMSGLRRVLPTMQSLAEDGLVGPNCGTHIHVGFSSSSRERLFTHFRYILGDLQDRMKSDEFETIRFWGRYFTNYADSGQDMQGRYSWCNTNTGSKPTIEFRLAKYRDAEQFAALICFVRKLANYLDRELSYPRSPDAYKRMAKRVLAIYVNAVEATALVVA